MTDYKKLKKKYKTTIWILIAGLITFFYSLTIKNTTIFSIIGTISAIITIVDFLIFKNYQKKLKKAEIIKIGTEEAIKNNKEKNQ